MPTPGQFKAVALDAAEVGTWEWDPFTHQSVWDETMYRLTGISPDVDGDATNILLGYMLEPDKQTVENTIAAQVASTGSGEKFRYEFRFRRPDNGEIRYLAARAVTRLNGSSHILLAGVMFDITDFRRMQDDLENADRAKNAMMATVAHELRSPLGAILSATHILESAMDKPPPRQLVEMLKRQGEHMLRMVEDLIDVTRSQRAGSMSVGHDRVHIAQVITRAVEVVEHLVLKNQHTLSLALPEQPVFIDGDSGRLLQVMTNLLQNSARYTPAGGKLLVKLTADDHSTYIEVEDNGPGVAADVKDHLFDLFVQSSVTAHRGGLGIGLALVKKIVEAHQGSIEHRGAVPHGTVFRVTLPRRHRLNDPVAV